MGYAQVELRPFQPVYILPDEYRSVLLIIPAYNEAECIASVVAEAHHALVGADILVIDDGSTDATGRRANEAGAIVLSHPFNLGIGGTVQTGFKFALQMGYDYVVRMDGDGQHDPAYLDALLSIVRSGQADVAVGSRFLWGAGPRHLAPLRRLGIRLFAKEVSWLTHHPATDTTSGMAALNRRATALLAGCMPQDYPEVESRILLHCAGLRVQEAPVRMRERLTGVSSIDSWRSLYYAVKVTVAVLLTAVKRRPVYRMELANVRPSALRRAHP
jgi:hypothetical protein